MNIKTRYKAMCHSYYLLFGMVGLGLISPLVKFFEETYHLSHASMGAVLGAASVVGAIGSLTGGGAFDRFGARFTMSVATALLAISVLGVYRSSAVPVFVGVLLLFYFSQGAGQAINAVVGSLYEGERTRGITLFHGFKGAGNLLAPILVAGTISVIGDWRPTMLVSAGVFSVWFFLFLLGFNDPTVLNIDARENSSHGQTEVRELVDQKLGLGLAGFLFLPGCEGVIRTWLPVFLMSEAAFTETNALFALSMIMTGYTLTRLLLGLNSHNGQSALILAAVLLMVISFFVVVNTDRLLVMYAFSFLLGASFAPYWPSLAGGLYDYAAHGHGVITGLFSTFGTIGAFSFMSLVGWLGESYTLKRALLVAPASAIAFGCIYYAFSFLGGVGEGLEGPS